MAQLSAKARANMPASAFAYIDPDGRRLLPIHDEAHVRNALARFNRVAFDDEAGADFAAFWERVNGVNPGVAAIGASDFHTTGAPGWCRTYVLARERTIDAVLEAVRDGRTVAAGANGVLYGNPQWIGLVESAGGFVSSPPPPDRWRRSAVACAWLGSLGLVIFGWRSRRY